MKQAIATTHYNTLPVIGSNLNAYFQQIADFPVLEAEEEKYLAERLRDHQDLSAAKRLVMSQLRFVVHIARSYSGYGLPLADLVQEGNIGLMKAVKRFDPDVGVRLISFAVHWIRAEIHEFVIRNWRIVKIATTKAQRKLFFKLRSSKKSLGWFTQDEVNAVADDLQVAPETVMEMEGRLASCDASFDIPEDADRKELVVAPASYLNAPDADPAQLLESADQSEWDNEALNNAIQQLDERSRAIIQKRWLSEKKATLHELADDFNVTAERIRQLEKNSMKKLKRQILAA